MGSLPELHVVIVGGGIAGLAAVSHSLPGLDTQVALIANSMTRQLLSGI